MEIRYCPQCGTNRFSGHSFCPSCGFDYGSFETRIGGTRHEPEDARLAEAVEVVSEYKLASAPMLERRMKIGPGRAARLIDQLEARGYLGPSDGSDARKVLGRDS